MAREQLHQQDIFGGETELKADKPKSVADDCRQGRLGLDGLDDDAGKPATIGMRLVDA